PVMLEKLKSAKHYIFMEYFIIDPGKFWDSILEVLLQKVKEGVEVRLIYDDLGCFSTLPEDYDKYLNGKGIKCLRYSPLKPIIDIRMNNRDHRKIMVIDGHTGFTGGINIADEYINEIMRFGKWKDNAIMLEGDGVFGLTNLFLSTWVRITGEETPNFKDYLPARYAIEVPSFKANGYVSVYGSIPYTYETVGLNVYEMLCYEARERLDIATPYLILNKEMESAICNAAKRGVRVRLLTPHIPDKKTVFELTRANYRMLLRSGVEIYEYSPGFVHAKMFLVDDRIATVGTINLDYRSLFLHSENGCLLYNTESIKDIANDFDETFKVSEQFELKKYNATPLRKKIFRLILQVFAPLM
ncbi:MAG: phosphatidylserine/phosphatidylglycerophosphate/cardiolipin synthase family protein, partial [Bacilli bacterium]|nr:phosphatidylserine/phosphatidylglycerophosphate/cardiolipin synthase family protein [Bacilli bacterium]